MAARAKQQHLWELVSRPSAVRQPNMISSYPMKGRIKPGESFIIASEPFMVRSHFLLPITLLPDDYPLTAGFSTQLRFDNGPHPLDYFPPYHDLSCRPLPSDYMPILCQCNYPSRSLPKIASYINELSEKEVCIDGCWLI